MDLQVLYNKGWTIIFCNFNLMQFKWAMHFKYIDSSKTYLSWSNIFLMKSKLGRSKIPN
jgi:hypothetical protein